MKKYFFINILSFDNKKEHPIQVLKKGKKRLTMKRSKSSPTGGK
jgi:hypothetical protein